MPVFPTIVSGKGGNFTFYPSSTSSAYTLQIESWNGNWQCDYDQVTPAGIGAGRMYLPIIGNHSWTLTYPLDQDTDQTWYAAGVTLNAGDVLYDCRFKRGTEVTVGSTTVYDRLQYTTVTAVELIDTQTDALRVRVTGMGGILTPYYPV